MKENFLPYESAKQLKELGYDGKKSLAYYDMGFHLQLRDTDFENAREIQPALTYAPLYQEAKQWLWDERALFIHANEINQMYGWCVRNGRHQLLSWQSEDFFDSPIEAENEGIISAINYLFNQIKK